MAAPCFWLLCWQKLKSQRQGRSRAQSIAQFHSSAVVGCSINCAILVCSVLVCSNPSHAYLPELPLPQTPPDLEVTQRPAPSSLLGAATGTATGTGGTAHAFHLSSCRHAFVLQNSSVHLMVVLGCRVNIFFRACGSGVAHQYPADDGLLLPK